MCPLECSKTPVVCSLVQGIENYEREKALYDGIVVEYLELEDIVRNQSNTGGPYESTLHTALPKVLAYLEWWWKCALRGPVLRYILPPPPPPPRLAAAPLKVHSFAS